MLTRLEVDGFKNLLGFRADFGPFNVLAGPNGAGKSNVFDAVGFLSLLADNTLMDAALAVRGTDADTSDLLDLFWTDGRERQGEIRLAAEMLVAPQVVDDFGREAQASSTFLRYEVRLGYQAPERPGQLGRLELRSETLDYVAETDAAKHLLFPHSAGKWREAVVVNRRHAKSGYISTRTGENGRLEVLVHQDAGSAGSPVAHAASAPRTIVATSNTAATPTILAARREMQQWRILSLDPDALRRPDPFSAEPYLDTHGNRLPAVLHRLLGESEDPEALRERLTRRLARLMRVRGLELDVDETRRLLSLKVHEDGAVLPARSLSDGALRFLALAILAEDPSCPGLICCEEPENGIHPAGIEALSDLLRGLAVDTETEPGPHNPLRQVIVASHSPVFVQLQDKEDLLFASVDWVGAAALSCRPLAGTWRDVDGQGVGRSALADFLHPLTSEQLQLTFEG